MNKNVLLARATLLTMVLLFGISNTTIATTYTATTSGNWSSSVTWGGTAPAYNITGADNVVVPLGVTVTLDYSVIMNNASSSLSVIGAITGTTDLTLTAGTLSGTGAVTVHSLTVGAGGFITSLGPISVSQLANSQAALALGSVISVGNSVVLNAGVVQLNTGGAINLANNATINMAGGAYSILGGGLLTLAGNFNLLYTGAVTTVGTEISLIGLQNVTVNLATPASNLSLAGNLAVAGLLSLQQGSLDLNGNSLTINGGINTASTGSIIGNASSSIIVNGTGSIGTIGLAAGAQTVNNLTLNIGSSGSVSLASNIIVAGVLSLNGSSLNLNGYTLTIDGSVSAVGAGSLIGSGTSNVTVNGSGMVGTLVFNSGGNTLGGLTVNIATAGSVSLGSNLTVSGPLTLSSGSLNLNGQSLIIGGTINPSGTGSISGNVNSNITFNGSGNAGTLVLTSSSQAINNLTINIGSSGTVALGSAATIGGALTLAQGNINVGNNDLTIAGTGSIQGGSAASYVVTGGSGSLAMTVANAGATGTFQVGTLAYFAPVTLTNNSTLAGGFNVIAHPGVLAHGTTGTDLSVTQGVVNTGWDVSSSLTTGVNVNLEMFWNTAMQVNGFDNTQAYVSHYTGGAWNTNTLAAASTHPGGTFSLALSGVTSFSPFAVFDKNTTTGINNVKAEVALHLYPNPATDVLQISVVEAGSYPALKIFNSIGNEIISQSIVSPITSLDISSFAPGIYFVSFNNEVAKFVKQ